MTQYAFVLKNLSTDEVLGTDQYQDVVDTVAQSPSNRFYLKDNLNGWEGEIDDPREFVAVWEQMQRNVWDAIEDEGMSDSEGDYPEFHSHYPN